MSVRVAVYAATYCPKVSVTTEVPLMSRFVDMTKGFVVESCISIPV